MSSETNHGGRTNRRRSAVMSDVAALAGVSHQTVSRVLNDSPQVRAETRERVLAAMRKLDYRPNLTARTLVTGRSRTLGVLAFATTLYGPASTLVGVERAAHASGYFVTVVSLESFERTAVADAIDRLRAMAVEGILVVAPQVATTSAVWALPEDMPVVAVGAGPEDGVPVAAVDQYQGAQLATQHLIELGHRTVAHIGGPQSWIESQQRIDGWRDAIDAAGLRAAPVPRGDWSARSGYDLGRRMFEEHDPTAVFVANDQMALGVLRALRELGRDVPGDVSVVGFDDIPEAGFYSPPLTTVRHDVNGIGRLAVKLLLAEIGPDAHPSARHTIATELVVRASTRPPRARS
jgi:DNA-binding LacI/PurR family transcriptional regulator